MRGSKGGNRVHRRAYALFEVCRTVDFELGDLVHCQRNLKFIHIEFLFVDYLFLFLERRPVLPMFLFHPGGRIDGLEL